ncbi:MAG: SMC-Scp complex subunit ScpB [Planctomycetia bacterium]|nr:SMC-Scp complex subunit ScpB [Planctomycetia bacterium]
MSDELSFEELSRAFARAMSGNTVSENSDIEKTETAENHCVSDDLVDIPDEFFGDDFTLDALEVDESRTDLAMYDENATDRMEAETNAEIGAFRSYADEIDDDKQVPVTPRTILEAMLFVGNPSNTPIPAETLSNLMRGVSVREVHELVEELNQHYDAEGCPWVIQWFEAEQGYFLQLRETFFPLRENFYGKIRQARLSQAAIDVLSLVAYEQPITAEEINQLRNAPSGPILAQLTRRQLIRTQKIRRGTQFVTVYFTTERFLKLFELESINDLPQSEDLDRE